jgi:DNA polymerase-3 subunit epsilon
MTEVSLVRSEYSDPGMPIPPEITEITGISDADVKGHKINTEDVKHWLENEDTYIIAHNSKFDRPFFTQLMEQDNYRWGCSASQIDWKSFKKYRIESPKLEYILLKLGYFYEGHRASIDCLAMVQMFSVLPEALEQLLKNIDQKSIIIEAPNSFEIKDKLKAAGYRWNGDNKSWCIEVPESEHERYLTELDHFSSNYSSSQTNQKPLTAKERFKLPDSI